jgi:hypothetical protein
MYSRSIAQKTAEDLSPEERASASGSLLRNGDTKMVEFSEEFKVSTVHQTVYKLSGTAHSLEGMSESQMRGKRSEHSSKSTEFTVAKFPGDGIQKCPPIVPGFIVAMVNSLERSWSIEERFPC